MKAARMPTTPSPRTWALLLQPLLLASLATAAIVDPADVSVDSVPPSCDSDIYCKGQMLHVVQTAKIFPDSKTFVDMKVRESPEIALKNFDTLMKETNNTPSYEDVYAFVNKTFEDGDELEEWVPTDWTSQPAILGRIANEKYREWASDLNALWKMLGRKMKLDVRDNPQLYSLLYVPEGFIIPGGRFKELYYWDSYWIVQGLLHCDMYDSVKGVIENLLHLVKTLGFVPNGSRVYYEERSQPPLLLAMAKAYYDKTHDLQFIRDNIDTLEQEFNFWMNNSMVDVERNGKTYKLARYIFLSNGPRPESYREDFETTEPLENPADRERMYWELKSGAATGWDFSSRWFIDDEGTNNGQLRDIKTTKIVPADLNAFLYGAARALQEFTLRLGQRVKSMAYDTIANEMREAVTAVLWNEADGIWYDWDALNKKQRQYFYGSNLAPLWADCYERENVRHIAAKVVNYIEGSKVLSFLGGTPSSLNNTGEQWDFPNCWAPLQAFIIQGLERTGQVDAQKLADELATRWLHANYAGYEQNHMMFEKYDAENVGRFGGGGEYTVQEGFGWTNGLIFELLDRYSGKGGSGGVTGGSGVDLSNSLANTVDRVRKGLTNKIINSPVLEALDVASQGLVRGLGEDKPASLSMHQQHDLSLVQGLGEHGGAQGSG